MARVLTALLHEPSHWEYFSAPWYLRAAYTARDAAVLGLSMAAMTAAVVILGSL